MISALRAPLRRTAVQASRSLRASAQPAARKYSTAPAGGSGSGLWIGLGVVVAAGGGYYVYSKGLTPAEAGKEAATAGKTGVAIAKAQAGFKPAKEDYQKVYNRIAEIMEAEGYDGKSRRGMMLRVLSANVVTDKWRNIF